MSAEGWGSRGGLGLSMMKTDRGWGIWSGWVALGRVCLGVLLACLCTPLLITPQPTQIPLGT